MSSKKDRARQRTSLLAVAWSVHELLLIVEPVVAANDKVSTANIGDIRERLDQVCAQLEVTTWDAMSAGSRRELEEITTAWANLRKQFLTHLWTGGLPNPGCAAWLGSLVSLVNDVCTIQRRGQRDPWSTLHTAMDRFWWRVVARAGHCHDMVCQTELYMAMAAGLPPLACTQTGGR